ncbi:MAG: aldo/keto reductase [Synechococcus sp. BS307-5m-G36]|nr:aldo/keto reductase [Synechococcus sp. BS307-5m-G36]MBL6880960.1 aldo/keto reductase [Synechococcus sp. BS30m-G31]
MGSLPTRRFGRTGLEIPLLSLGTMRCQQSWSDLPAEEISDTSQLQLQATLDRAVAEGFHHVETARHYGTSERQLGWALPKAPDAKRLLQSKVPPRDDVVAFEAELELSFERLDCDRLDLLAIHGINLPEHLEQTLRPGGCMEVVRRWQAQGRIGSVGFSTHGPTELIEAACNTGAFDYLNVHWYYIRQDNGPALDAARRQDMGVFIISPTDKGGHLHSPSQKMLDLCAPLHPIEFNDLFCLQDERVHTISVGAASPTDFDRHLKAIELLPNAVELIEPVHQRLEAAAVDALGREWMATWHVGLPSWQDTPGEINLPVLLWLHNLLEAWDLESFATARYRLLGHGGHWFAGSNADSFDDQVSVSDLQAVLGASPWRARIPIILAELKQRLAGDSQKRLTSI